tara:strand:- start:457 stop:630 length:174 start_codon:yes stop_codon:yes gene_type:complete
MDELLDLVTSDEASPSQISDKIKDLLFMKASERVDELRPEVSANLFADTSQDSSQDD